jgi:hypothetical protein
MKERFDDEQLKVFEDVLRVTAKELMNELDELTEIKV